MPNISLLRLNNLAAQLNAGRPVMLMLAPSFMPLQKPDLVHGLISVSRVHPLTIPGILRLDFEEDCGLLLVEDRRGSRRNG
ncbi:MAG: hypothetical protein ACOYO0_11915 [Sandarakinorhabdus sp.]